MMKLEELRKEVPMFGRKKNTGELATHEDEEITPLSVKADYHGYSLEQHSDTTLNLNGQTVDTSYYEGAENALSNWMDRYCPPPSRAS